MIHALPHEHHRRLALLVDHLRVAHAGQAHVVVCQLREVERLVPVPAVHEVGPARQRVLKERHVPAVAPVGQHELQKAERPLRPVRDGQPRVRERVVAAVRVEPHHILSGRGAAQHLRPLDNALRAERVPRFLNRRKRQPLEVPAVQVAAFVAAHAAKRHASAHHAALHDVVRVLVFAIPIPQAVKACDHAAVRLNGPALVIEPAGSVFHACSSSGR